MTSLSKARRYSFISRIISGLTAVTFIITSVASPAAFAQVIPGLTLPQPGTMVMPTAAFSPLMIKGVNIHPDNALMFDFVMDEGDTHYNPEQFKEETRRLIRYFMASLTVPQEEMWVNLSPYEQDRIIPDTFGQTEMGRDLLAQDYMLKQLTSSLMYPEDGLGKKFWKRVRKLAKERYGTTDIPMDTYNKIWIVPETARIYEHEKGAFVVESRLKVMLEEDYLALAANQGRSDHGIGDVKTEELRSQKDVTLPIVRELLIPEIEREVNEGKIFANLRQIHNAMVLAKWYKDRLKESLLGQVYVDQGKTAGVNVQDPEIANKIYDQYVDAFKKGVFDFIKEDYDEDAKEVLPRRYFSGGIVETGKYATQEDRPRDGAASIVRAGFQPPDKSEVSSKKQFKTYGPKAKRAAKHYNRAALQGSYWLDESPLLNRAAESIFERGIIPKDKIDGATVLDIATGMGLMARAAAKYGAKEVVGVDIASEMIKQARQNFKELPYETKFTGITGNIAKLSKVLSKKKNIPKKFDVITLGNITTLLPDDELKKVLEDALDFLKEGGFLVILYRSFDHRLYKGKEYGIPLYAKEESGVWEKIQQYYSQILKESGFAQSQFYVASVETDEDWGMGELGDLQTIVNENTVFYAQKPQVSDKAALAEFKAYAQTHAETLHQRTVQNPLITYWQGKVGELYNKHKIYDLSIVERLDFVVNVLSDGAYAAVVERLKQLYDDYQDYVGADGRLSAQGYTRMNRQLLEQEGRMTVKEYKYLRFGMGLVYDISDREQRILEQQYLLEQMAVELEHSGRGDLPVTASMQDLHGGARRAMALGGFALGLDALAYERIETLEDLKTELKKADIDLKNLPVTITGLNDKYDRGKRPGETFDLVRWLEETGKGRSITGNHDLWRLLAVLQVHRLFPEDEILRDENKQHHPGFWAQDAFPHAMWGDVELAQILEERYNAAVDRYNTAVRENERIQQGLKRKDLEMEDVLLERIDLDAERGHYEKEVKRLKKLNAAIQAENAERSAQEQKPYHSLPNIFEKILHHTREQRELANAFVRNVEQDFEVQSLPRIEFYEVNMDNYWRDPKVVAKALWDGRKFRLFDINILRALEQHGMMPFNQDAGGFDVTYKGLTGLDALQLMQEEVQEFFEPLKTLPDTEVFRKEMWDKIGEILSIVNDWYSDKTQYAKIAKFKKALLPDMGAAATQNGLWAGLAKMTSGAGRSVGWGTLLILGHNESGKLTDFPWAFLNPELATGLLQIDQSLSEGYENRGGILTMLKRNPDGQVTGLRLWGYAAPEATEITDLTRDERFLKNMTPEQRAMLDKLTDGEGFMRWYIQQTNKYLEIEAGQMLEEAEQQGRHDKAQWAARVMGQEAADGASMSQNLEQMRRKLDYMQSRYNVSMFNLWTTLPRDSVFEGLRSEIFEISRAVVRDYEKSDAAPLSRGIAEAYVVVANAFAPGDAAVQEANQQMTTALTRFDTTAQRTGNDDITINFRTEAANGLATAVYQYQKFIKDHPQWLEEGVQPADGMGESGAGAGAGDSSAEQAQIPGAQTLENTRQLSMSPAIDLDLLNVLETPDKYSPQEVDDALRGLQRDIQSQVDPETFRKSMQRLKAGDKLVYRLPVRLFDGPGSSFDLKLFKELVAELIAQGRISREQGFQALGTLSAVISDITDENGLYVEVEFSGGLAGKNSYIAPDYFEGEYISEQATPLDTKGRLPGGQKNAADFVARLFGVDGLQIKLRLSDPSIKGGGLEGSNAFSLALFSAMREITGARLTDGDLYGTGQAITLGPLADVTGLQGWLAGIAGNVQIFFTEAIQNNGVETHPRGAILKPLFDNPEVPGSLEPYIRVGRIQSDGNESIKRTATLINTLWTFLLENRDSRAIEQVIEMLTLAHQYAGDVGAGNIKGMQKAMKQYVELRDRLTLRAINLAFDAHEGKEGPEYATKLAKIIFEDSKNSEDAYESQFSTLREAYEKGKDIQELLRTRSLYSFDMDSEMRAFMDQKGIVVMPLGAGGPGANCLFIAQDPGAFDEFLEKYGEERVVLKQQKIGTEPMRAKWVSAEGQEQRITSSASEPETVHISGVFTEGTAERPLDTIVPVSLQERMKTLYEIFDQYNIGFGHLGRKYQDNYAEYVKDLLKDIKAAIEWGPAESDFKSVENIINVINAFRFVVYSHGDMKGKEAFYDAEEAAGVAEDLHIQEAFENKKLNTEELNAFATHAKTAIRLYGHLIAEHVPDMTISPKWGIETEDKAMLAQTNLEQGIKLLNGFFDQHPGDLWEARKHNLENWDQALSFFKAAIADGPREGEDKTVHISGVFTEGTAETTGKKGIKGDRAMLVKGSHLKNGMGALEKIKEKFGVGVDQLWDTDITDEEFINLRNRARLEFEAAIRDELVRYDTVPSGTGLIEMPSLFNLSSGHDLAATASAFEVVVKYYGKDSQDNRVNAMDRVREELEEVVKELHLKTNRAFWYQKKTQWKIFKALKKQTEFLRKVKKDLLSDALDTPMGSELYKIWKKLDGNISRQDAEMKVRNEFRRLQSGVLSLSGELVDVYRLFKDPEGRITKKQFLGRIDMHLANDQGYENDPWDKGILELSSVQEMLDDLRSQGIEISEQDLADEDALEKFFQRNNKNISDEYRQKFYEIWLAGGASRPRNIIHQPAYIDTLNRFWETRGQTSISDLEVLVQAGLFRSNPEVLKRLAEHYVESEQAAGQMKANYKKGREILEKDLPGLKMEKQSENEIAEQREQLGKEAVKFFQAVLEEAKPFLLVEVNQFPLSEEIFRPEWALQEKNILPHWRMPQHLEKLAWELIGHVENGDLRPEGHKVAVIHPETKKFIGKADRAVAEWMEYTYMSVDFPGEEIKGKGPYGDNAQLAEMVQEVQKNFVEKHSTRNYYHPDVDGEVPEDREFLSWMNKGLEDSLVKDGNHLFGFQVVEDSKAKEISVATMRDPDQKTEVPEGGTANMKHVYYAVIVPTGIVDKGATAVAEAFQRWSEGEIGSEQQASLKTTALTTLYNHKALEYAAEQIQGMVYEEKIQQYIEKRGLKLEPAKLTPEQQALLTAANRALSRRSVKYPESFGGHKNITEQFYYLVPGSIGLRGVVEVPNGVFVNPAPHPEPTRRYSLLQIDPDILGQGPDALANALEKYMERSYGNLWGKANVDGSSEFREAILKDMQAADAAQVVTIKQAQKKLKTGMEIVEDILEKHPQVKLARLWAARFKNDESESLREKAIDVFAEAVGFVLEKIANDDVESLPEDADFWLGSGVAMMAVASTQVGDTFKQGNSQIRQALDEWASLKEDEAAGIGSEDEDWDDFRDAVMAAMVQYAKDGLRQTASALVKYNQKKEATAQSRPGQSGQKRDDVDVMVFGEVVKMPRKEAVEKNLSYVEPGQGKGDEASLQNGGIDLNAQIAETIVEDNGRVFQMPPVTLEDLEFYMNVQGFEPVIINVTPPQPLPVILGYAKEPEAELASL